MRLSRLHSGGAQFECLECSSAFPSSCRPVWEVMSYRGVTLAPALRGRVDVDGRRSEAVHLVKKGMVSLDGNGVASADVKRRIDRDLHLGMKLVTDPAHTNIVYGLHPGCVFQDTGDLVDQFRIDRIHKSVVDVSSCVLQHEKNRHGDEKSHGRIGELPTSGHPDGPEQDGEGSEPISARVKTIGDQRS